MAVYQYITNTGTILPDTATIRTDVIDEYRGVFGQDLITDDESPEGVLINAETTSRQSIARNNAALANQINPNLAGGPFLDAIWALTGGQRVSATHSTVTATITGVANTVIPSGSQASTTNGDIFETVTQVIIPTGGTLTGVDFRSVEPGLIDIGANALNTVASDVLGWETVTNPAAGVRGRETESDATSRLRRRFEIGLQGRSTAQAVTSNLLDVEGVISLAYRENTTSTSATIDGITLAAHSVWVSVQGGLAIDIARALLRSKTAGAAWNGAQTASVIDDFSRQAYTVRFDRPTIRNLQVRVTVSATSAVVDPVSVVRQSILDYANNQTNELGFVIGSDVSAFELSGIINQNAPNVFVSLVEIADKSDSPTYQSSIFNVETNQLPAIASAGDIIVVVQ